MYSFLLTTGAWFIKLATSDLVVAIIKKLVEILVQYIKDVIPLVLDEIVKAANNPDLKSEQKFDAVYTIASAKFDNVPTSVLRVIIEVCYTFLKSSLETN
jgi:phage-related protein